jgi:hypothetical protein
MDDMARRLEEALKRPFAGIKATEPAKPAAPVAPAAAPAVAPTPQTQAEPPIAAVPVQAPPLAIPAEKAAPAPVEIADFDTLEAEMSRLLGRDPGPPKT